MPNDPSVRKNAGLLLLAILLGVGGLVASAISKLTAGLGE